MRNTLAIVLAAGKGTRMQSEQFNSPKVMREILGRPMLSYVLGELDFLNKENIVIVTGYMHEAVESAFPGYKFALQSEQKGTGHAVMAATEFLQGFDGNILISYGDMPLVTIKMYKDLIGYHEQSGADFTLLAGTSDDDLHYGRVIRGADGSFKEIVEHRDCTAEQLEIKDLYAGIAVVDSKELLSALGELTTDNAQNEYYFTDVPKIMLQNGKSVSVCVLKLGKALTGVNTPADAQSVEGYLRQEVGR